jgi:hypothetical protein
MRRTHSIADAACVILGSTQTESYWGFSFESFTSRFHSKLHEVIGDPRLAPWLKAIDFTSDDYVELEQSRAAHDFTSDPATHMDEQLALEFARRSDILGMHGPIGSGKDTAADSLAPHGFVGMSFSDTLRIAATLIYGIPPRYFLARDLKGTPLPNSTMSPRRVLQLLGVEVIRSIHEPTLVKRTLLRMASAMHDLPGYARNAPQRISAAGGIRAVLRDVRVQNEADTVRNLGGRIAWVSRPSLDVAKVAATAGYNHSTEAGITSAASDIRLLNVGSLEAFQAEAARTLIREMPASRVPAPKRDAGPESKGYTPLRGRFFAGGGSESERLVARMAASMDKRRRPTEIHVDIARSVSPLPKFCAYQVTLRPFVSRA